MSRAYRFWTDRETERLCLMRASGSTFAECAAVLNRTLTSVKARAVRVSAVRKRPKGQVANRRAEVARLHARGQTILQMHPVLKTCGGGRAQLARDHKALGLVPNRIKETPQ